MNNNLIQLKIKQRLNKLSSNDYDNIECWKIQEAFNKVQLDWIRKQLHGGNQYREGDEQSLRRVDDLQLLLTSKQLGGGNRDSFYQTASLPADYLAFKRVTIKGKTDECPEARSFKVYLAEEADANVHLSDKNTQPSFEWGETFCTLFGNRIRIYTNNEFNIVEPTLVYYRKPKPIQILGCVNPSNDKIYTVEQECEFKDDIIEVLIDEAASILAGDIESMIQVQRESQNADKNN